MKEFDGDSWRGVRSKGLFGYILVQGFFARGLPLYLAFAALYWLATKELLVAHAFGLLGLGAYLSLLTWHRNERCFSHKTREGGKQPEN